MTDKTELEVTREDRELFILLLGFDAVHSGKDLDRIHKGDFDHWEKMKAIARHRLATRTPDPTPAVPADGLVEMVARAIGTHIMPGSPWEASLRAELAAPSR